MAILPSPWEASPSMVKGMELEPMTGIWDPTVLPLRNRINPGVDVVTVPLTPPLTGSSIVRVLARSLPRSKSANRIAGQAVTRTAMLVWAETTPGGGVKVKTVAPGAAATSVTEALRSIEAATAATEGFEFATESLGAG